MEFHLTKMLRTYPSMYLVVEGAVTVTDKCGVRGMIHTNPTIPIPPHGLTELSFWDGYQPAEGYHTLPYDPAVPADCRTYGFSNPQITSGWYQVNDNTSSVTTSTLYVPGYPFNPFLVPPQQLIDLDPAWKTCLYWSSWGNQYGQLTCKLKSIYFLSLDLDHILTHSTRWSI